MSERIVLPPKLNNKGLSLVELIIAISIGVIVSGSIAALITFSIRMYTNESTNTAMQYELQSNINMMMDEIMGASVMVVKQSGEAINVTGKPYTQYAMFGKVANGVTLGVGGTGQRFDGVIFVSGTPDSGKFSILVDRFSQEGATLDIESIASSKYTAISGASDQTPYLLGENATQFVIEPDPNSISFDTTDPINPTYINPIEVKVELDFEKNGWGTKKYNKHVDDLTYLRNKVTESVYVDDGSGTFTEYTLKKKDE